MLGVNTIFTSTINSILASDDKYVTVKAGTGSGKTTTLPCELCKKNNKFRICVILPTREAVYNAYERANTNQIRGVNVDFSVGFAANSIVKYSNKKIAHIRNILYQNQEITCDENDTRLVYCTVGHFLNVIKDTVKYIQDEDSINSRSINIFDYVFIDEIHLRSMNVDLIVGILKYLLISFSNKLPPKVICTSATWDEPKLYNVIDSVTFKVLVHYFPTFEERKMNMTQRLNQFGYGIDAVLKNLTGTFDEGIVLVFLPGISQIKISMKQLIECNEDNKYEIVYAHSSVSEEDMKCKVFTPNTQNKIKIILATNIAETSITIPFVSVIIDSCIENVRETGSNKVIFNKMEYISKDSAKQRAGRTGRTNDGIVIRMISLNEYENLKESRIPEIERLPITNELLHILDCNIDVRFIFGDINNGISRTITEKQANRINLTLKELNYLGLIKKCGDFYNVTKIGKFVSSLIIGAKAGTLIYKAIKAGIDPYPVIVLACFIENAEVLYEKFRPPHEFMSDIPFASLILPWLKLCSEYGQIKISLEELKKFCSKHELNYDGFHDVQRKIIDTMIKISNYNIDVDVYMFEPEDVFLKVKYILDELYFNYQRKGEFYFSTNPKIKHRPLELSSEFNNSNPEFVTSILNMVSKDKISNKMVIWYDSKYIPKNTYLIDDEISKHDKEVTEDYIETEEGYKEDDDN